jgi:cysteine desulfurase
MDDDPIYLDHNATTPIDGAVLDAMLPYLREHFGNPSSDHPYGRRAKAAVARARVQVAALIGAPAEAVIFTSGGTEANNLAIRGALATRPGRWVVTTAVEHPAVVEVVAGMPDRALKRAPVGADGRVDAAAFADTLCRDPLRDDTSLVTVMHANNVTGAIQPVRAVADAARARGIPVHTDAAQSLGKVPVDVDALGVDLLSIAGHKLYAPKGVGALYARPGLDLPPLLRGAGHEAGRRPGTENVASIVGLGVACALAARTLDAEADRVRRLRDGLHALLAAAVPGLALNGPVAARLPNTLNVRFPGVRGSAVLAGAPEVAASTGSACHAGDESPSGALLAMGLSPDVALGSVRLSLGRHTDADDVARAAAALIRSWRGLTR